MIKNIKLDHRKLNRRYLMITRRYATFGAGLLAASLLIGFFVMVPQLNSSYQLWGEARSAQKSITELQQKVAQLVALPESVLLSQEGAINAVLPSHKPLLELLNSFSQVAQQTNVSFSDVSLSPGRIATDSASLAGAKSRSSSSRKLTDFDQIDLELSIAGRLVDVQQFLEKIETVAPVTSVTRMSLNEKQARAVEGEEGELEELFEAQLVTTTYFFTKSVTAAISAPVPELSAAQNKVLQEVGLFTVPVVTSQTQIRGGGQEDLFGVSSGFELN
jgi:hypothetical protein